MQTGMTTADKILYRVQSLRGYTAKIIRVAMNINKKLITR